MSSLQSSLTEIFQPQVLFKKLLTFPISSLLLQDPAFCSSCHLPKTDIHGLVFGIRSVQTRQFKPPWQQTQLTLGREIVRIAAGMVWHDQHMPLMRDFNKRAFQQSLFLRIHLRSLYLGCNALHTLLYLLNYHVNTIINNEIFLRVLGNSTVLSYITWKTGFILQSRKHPE